MTVMGGPTTDAAPSSARRPDSGQRERLVMAGIGAAVGVVLALVMRERLADDAYISLSYARNLAELGHWGLIEARTANTATSPLNVWLLAVGFVLTGSPLPAVAVVLAGALGLVGWWAAGIAHEHRLSRLLPVGAVAVFAVSPLLISTVGLETYLGAALIVGAARYAAAGRWCALGVVGGLLVLCRPDLGVIAAVLTLAIPAVRRCWWRSALVGLAVTVPWHAWSWVMLGGAVPDTLLFKMGDAKWEGFGFADGIGLYWRHFPAATALTAAPAAAGLGMMVACVWWRHPARPVAVALGLAGVAHFAVYALVGTAPYAWYYAPATVCLTLCALVGLAGESQRALAAARVGALVLITGVFLVQRRDDGLGPIIYNYGTAAQYATVGTELGQVVGPTAPVRGYIEIGTIAFFCRCTVLEQFTDPALADQVIDRRVAGAGPLGRWLIEANGAHRPRAAPTATGWLISHDATPGYRARWVIDVPARGRQFLELRELIPPALR